MKKARIFIPLHSQMKTEPLPPKRELFYLNVQDTLDCKAPQRRFREGERSRFIQEVKSINKSFSVISCWMSGLRRFAQAQQVFRQFFRHLKKDFPVVSFPGGSMVSTIRVRNKACGPQVFSKRKHLLFGILVEAVRSMGT